MSHLGRRITNIFFAFVLAVMSVNLSGVLSLQSAFAASNNGTLQVHEKGSPEMTPSNQPHVCVFNFEAFNLDANQTGNVTIEAQSPTSPITPVVIPLTTDGSGNGSTAPYVNDAGSPYSLADGHYKATLDNKFGTDNGNKAKSKVFWVRCTTTPVTPAQPTVSVAPTCTKKTTTTGSATITVTNTEDETGAVASYTVAVTGKPIQPITNLADGASQNVTFSNLTAGTYTVTVTGSDNTSATTTFKIEVCAPETVTPTAPTPSDQCGTDDDTYTIPATSGVIYKVNGSTKGADTYDVTALQYITGVHIVAYPANADVVLSGKTSWDFSFKTKPCPAPATEPSKHEECGTDKDSYTIPSSAHIKYYVNGQYKAAGTYYNVPQIAIITAVADNGYYVQGQAIWVYAFSSKPCPQPCHDEVRDFITPLTLNSQRHHHDDEDCIPVQPKDDTETRTITEEPVCLPNGGGSVKSWKEERSRTYTYDSESNTWIAGDWSDWVKVAGSEETTPATSEECPTPECPKPSTVEYDRVMALTLQQVQNQNNNCTPGQGGAGGETPEDPKAPVVTELPQTGPEAGDTFAKFALIVAAGISTYGAVFFAVNRRELLKK